MWEKIKTFDRDLLATIFGVATTLCTAWASIDWSSFDIKRDYMKLIISAIAEIGGYFTVIKKKQENDGKI